MPPPTYERLRHTIAERMRMSPIDQPLMLLELLGQGFARQLSDDNLVEGSRRSG
jgi:hypothetical protein